MYIHSYCFQMLMLQTNTQQMLKLTSFELDKTALEGWKFISVEDVLVGESSLHSLISWNSSLVLKYPFKRLRFSRPREIPCGPYCFPFHLLISLLMIKNKKKRYYKEINQLILVGIYSIIIFQWTVDCICCFICIYLLNVLILCLC